MQQIPLGANCTGPCQTTVAPQRVVPSRPICALSTAAGCGKRVAAGVCPHRHMALVCKCASQRPAAHQCASCAAVTGSGERAAAGVRPRVGGARRRAGGPDLPRALPGPLDRHIHAREAGDTAGRGPAAARTGMPVPCGHIVHGRCHGPAHACRSEAGRVTQAARLGMRPAPRGGCARIARRLPASRRRHAATCSTGCTASACSCPALSVTPCRREWCSGRGQRT